MWWVRDPDRLKSEIAAVDALREREAWLVSAVPRPLRGLRLGIDFEIAVNGESFAFTLEYPAFFPDTPPVVMPRDEQRLSQHQYGAGGELCLEYRSDNWDPLVTGAMMIASAHRLIAGERPDANRAAEVPSAHQTSVGQRLRGEICRFLLTPGFSAYASSLAVGAVRSGKAVDAVATKGVWCAYLDHVGPSDGVEWQETGIPKRPQDGEDAFIVRVDDLGAIPVVPDQENLDKLTGDAAAGVAAIAGYFVVAVDRTSARMFYSFPREGMRRVMPYTTVDLTDDPSGRLAASYDVLAQKRIGIVGGGSLGLKIAISLARSGVGAFVLVDDDILKPGNLVRHDLDAASLGAHKVEAIAERLRRVSATVAVSPRRVVLGGQESSGSTASVLDELATCDLVIDATGDPLAFNLVASVARNALRPMVWAEVYAGGIGGFVARVRPDLEPPPHAARRQYLSWCEQQGVPWVHQDADYGRRGEAIAPLVADDADVMVIAAHTCRMAVDALVRPDGSLFPHPAYVIGLATEWLFAEPFDTRPVDFVAEGTWRTMTPARTTEAIEFMTSLFDTGEDDDATRRTGT